MSIAINVTPAQNDTPHATTQFPSLKRRPLGSREHFRAPRFPLRIGVHFNPCLGLLWQTKDMTWICDSARNQTIETQKTIAYEAQVERQGCLQPRETGRRLGGILFRESVGGMVGGKAINNIEIRA